MDPRLTIDDESIRRIASHCSDCGRRLESDISTFLNILEAITDESLLSGNTADAIKRFHDSSARLYGIIQSTSNTADTVLRSMLSDINDKDQYLY